MVTTNSPTHLHHCEAIGKFARVPSEVLLAVGMLDVEPHDVHRDVVLVKLPLDCVHIFLVIVIPSRNRRTLIYCLSMFTQPTCTDDKRWQTLEVLEWTQ